MPYNLHLDRHGLHYDWLYRSIALRIDLRDLHSHIVAVNYATKHWMSGVARREPVQEAVVSDLRKKKSKTGCSCSPCYGQHRKGLRARHVDEKLRPAGIRLAGVGH